MPRFFFFYTQRLSCSCSSDVQCQRSSARLSNAHAHFYHLQDRVCSSRMKLCMQGPASQSFWSLPSTRVVGRWNRILHGEVAVHLRAWTLDFIKNLITQADVVLFVVAADGWFDSSLGLRGHPPGRLVPRWWPGLFRPGGRPQSFLFSSSSMSRFEVQISGRCAGRGHTQTASRSGALGSAVSPTHLGGGSG